MSDVDDVEVSCSHEKASSTFFKNISSAWNLMQSSDGPFLGKFQTDTLNEFSKSNKQKKGFKIIQIGVAGMSHSLAGSLPVLGLESVKNNNEFVLITVCPNYENLLFGKSSLRLPRIIFVFKKFNVSQCNKKIAAFGVI